MEVGRNPEWEQDYHVPIRAGGGEDGGGPLGPSTSRGEWELVPKKTDKFKSYHCCYTLGQVMHRKARHLTLGDA